MDRGVVQFFVENRSSIIFDRILDRSDKNNDYEGSGIQAGTRYAEDREYLRFA
jgi:hypothetical protein